MLKVICPIENSETSVYFWSWVFDYDGYTGLRSQVPKIMQEVIGMAKKIS